MKKYLFYYFILYFLCSAVYADSLNEVYLDLNETAKDNIFDKQKQEIHYTKVDLTSDSNELQNKNFNNDNLYSKKTFSNKKEKNFGKTTLGAKYDTTINPDNISQKRTLYSNYGLSEKITIGATYETDSMQGIEAQTKGTVGVGPEYKFNNKIKLKNKYSKNLSNNSNKGEVSVEYKPFKDDRMDFNAGAAQVQQDNGGNSSSQVNFGTNFRF